MNKPMQSTQKGSLVRVERKDHVARMILQAPGNRNALSLEMIDCLGRKIAELSEDKHVRVIVLAAEGPAFCAGHDLKELTLARQSDDRGRDFYKTVMTRCSELMMSIVRSPKPVIAEIDGVATAAGCQLVASCDLAVCTPSSKFATPGVNIGLFCSTPMVALSRNVAPKHAMEMLLTGELIDASQALSFGLVNRVADSGEIRDAVDRFATKIASKSPAVIKIGKEAFYAQAEMSLADAYAYTAGVMVENMMHADAAEGIGAFVEKREPKWQDD